MQAATPVAPQRATACRGARWLRAAVARDVTPRGAGGLALVAPALAVIALFFVVPLVLSAVLAFRGKDGGFTLEHFDKAFELYTTDLLFTIGDRRCCRRC